MKISFTLDRTERVLLEVYDMAGKHVTTINDEFLPAGDREFNWNCSDLLPGTYVLSLVRGDHMMYELLLVK